jgi:cytochrome c oxidase subunit II
MRDFLSWALPPGASTFVGDTDPLYYAILWVTGIAFVLVEAALIWFLIKYRARPGQRAHYTHGNVKAEYIWTGVTALVVVWIGLASAGGWKKIKGYDSAPADALPLTIRAKQFEWHVGYPGRDGRLGTADDYSVRGQLHVPVNRAVVATLEAEDVIHSFFVPQFRIKQDAVPGMNIRVWFQPTQVGTYEIGCAELCGLGHYRMRGVVTVHSQEDYDRWVAGRTTTAAAR